MPGAPNFKNSRLRLLNNINSTDQITVAFWLNIDNPELSEQLEKYYATAGKTPSIQLQKKLMNGYDNIASANLFLSDEKKAMYQSQTSEPPRDQTIVNGDDDDGFPGA